ncbi:sulfatase [Halalkalibaculum sp. DA3122]
MTGLKKTYLVSNSKIVVLVVFFLCFGTKMVKAQPENQPNIVFVLIDDQRYDFLSFLDHPWIETPNIDRLAKNGMYFENAYVTTSLCSPSRASILTGQYAHSHQVMDNNTPLPSHIPTFPVKLQKQGYHTGFIGKWHMGGDNDMPRPGFDRWVSFRGQGAYNDPTFNIDGQRSDHTGYTTDLLTDYAVDFIEENARGETPYFLYLSHKAIHEDFTPAPRHQGHYEDLNIPKPETFANTEVNYEGKPLWVKRQRNSWHGAERDFAAAGYGSYNRFFQLYSEAMLSVDESVGKITETLRDLGHLEETVIIYYSDNGYMMGEHGLIDKRVMYEESIRVPAFVHWPEQIRTPVKREEFILNIDIGPTILELAGSTVPSTMQGMSFARMLKGQPINWRTDFLYEYFIDPKAVQTPTTWGLRTQNYSYMTYEGIWSKYELYDMRKDPKQTNNLLGNIKYGHVYGSFLDKVERQDPKIWKTVKRLDQRLNDLINEKEGKRTPNWEKE